MKVDVDYEDILIFHAYLKESGYNTPESIPHKHLIRRMASAVRKNLIDPPIMAPGYMRGYDG
jgi:hypothetical protein